MDGFVSGFSEITSCTALDIPMRFKANYALVGGHIGSDVSDAPDTQVDGKILRIHGRLS